MTLAGKTIIVTGTSRGIGAETARQMSEAGVRVIGMDRNETTENVATYIPLDLADATSIEAAVAQIDEPIHGLCNIAGVAPTLPPAAVLKINFLGTRLLTDTLAPKLVEGASIVNIASGTAMGWPRNIDKLKALMDLGLGDDLEAYCSENGIEKANSYQFSKEAVIVWTIQQWKTWSARNIRMNSVSPGPIETPLLPDFLSDMTPPDAPMYEMERNGTPEEIAEVILFLQGESSRWIHAANIPVDGGLTAIVQKRIHQL
ncbi:MAG: coniferyl-alcohol dehydrogenase [Chloroflexota bacterium]